ncbi:phospholipase D family protein [Haloimpatiens lingqiaonensis]|uniref:phospholipase D family protein n=1 Tax=Haloimpatiens lingqiaonensis TaxID=1380675 RepID=UPI001484DCC3|nr:phospholipase D family protein [Haloimpatiens lingqiaonensis]
MNLKFLYNHKKSNCIGEQLKQIIVGAKDEIIIIVPYIAMNQLINILDTLDGIKIKILTRLSLEDFINNSSDINILNKLIKKTNIQIRYYSNLHAKIYVIDGEKAIVTSANFTQNGMYNNLEYGVLVEGDLKDIMQDINNLWNNAGVVNEELIASIREEINVLETCKNRNHKIKDEISKINNQIIENKRSHLYKKVNFNIKKVDNSISEDEALNFVINECGMKNIREKIIEIYNLIKANIPKNIRETCSFRYRKNVSRVDIAANIMNYRIFLLPYMKKPVVEIIYPKNDFYNLRTIISQERFSSQKKSPVSLQLFSGTTPEV